MKQYLHRKGQHTRSPFVIPGFTWAYPVITATARFSGESAYLHKDPAEQADWNKLFGLDFSPITPGNMGPAMMCGWRYLANHSIQIGLYTHNSANSRVLPEENSTIINVPFNEPIRIDLRWQNGSWKFRVEYKDRQFMQTAIAPARLNRLARKIYPWFGGNMPAPNDVKLELDID